MSSTQFLIDAATRHQIFVLRYGAGRARESVIILNRLRIDVNARLALEPSAFQAQRLTDVLRDIDRMTRTALGTLQAGVEAAARDMVISEADFTVSMMNKASSIDYITPQSAALTDAVMSTPMSTKLNSGVTITDALKTFSVKKAAQIGTVIVDGMTLGDTTQMIARSVGGLINNLMQRQITTLVNTIINHASSVSRAETYRANKKLVGQYQWVATLDGITSLLCMGLDGTVYDVDAGPMPPAHLNCRSTTIPKIRKEHDLGLKIKGLRPSIGSDGVKQVDSKTTYGGWLRDQSKEFVDEALGVERSRLFRTGGMTIDKFTDPTGRVYTLAQLESMAPITFSDL